MRFFVALTILEVAICRCPLGGFQGLLENDCYKQSVSPDTWYGAEAYCQSIGGHLASISSAFVNAVLREQCSLWASEEYWLGASVGITSTNWSWTDGTAFVYKNWAKGQPSNGTSLCLSASVQNGLWFAESCYQLKPYLCKVPSIPDDCPANPTGPTRAPTKTGPQQCHCSTTSAKHTSANTTPHPVPRCDFGWHYINVTRNCWQEFGTNYGGYWNDQVEVCKKNNSTVISIHSVEQNNALFGFAYNNEGHDEYGFRRAVWIGLHAPNGRWQWTDGSAFDYANWSENGEAHCSSNAKDCTVAVAIIYLDGYPGRWTGYDDGYGPDGGAGEGYQPIVCVKAANY